MLVTMRKNTEWRGVEEKKFFVTGVTISQSNDTHPRATCIFEVNHLSENDTNNKFQKDALYFQPQI